MNGDEHAPIAPEEIVEEQRRSRRSVRFIVTVVAVGAAVLVVLALWVQSVGYAVEVDGRTRSCRTDQSWTAISASEHTHRAIEQACADAKDRRRNQALLIGAGVFTVACAVSTWPSRRLTGERLGPLR